MPDLTCEICGKLAYKKPIDATNIKTGRPWKHAFCSQSCYAKWVSKQHGEVKKQYHRFQRSVWGTTPLERFEAGKSKAYGREGERKAMKIMDSLGFTEIEDLSGMSNQFFIDFVATYGGKRVLVDATIKLRAHIPEKVRLAKALRMPLFILHVSPVSDGLFYLNSVPLDHNSVRVPAEFIRRKAMEAQ